MLGISLSLTACHVWTTQGVMPSPDGQSRIIVEEGNLPPPFPLKFPQGRARLETPDGVVRLIAARRDCPIQRSKSVWSPKRHQVALLVCCAYTADPTVGYDFTTGETLPGQTAAEIIQRSINRNQPDGAEPQSIRSYCDDGPRFTAK